jgi:hypothetical protein
MFTDIVGYTALMSSDEDAALELLKKNRLIQNPLIQQYHGKLLKEMGDGILARFSSVSDSIHCAYAIQKACLNEHNLSLRIGIHQGEVVNSGEDIFGDGVNIASRLESMAIPGSILISAKVRDDVKNQKSIQTVSLGSYELKNVSEPVEIFAVSNPGLVVPQNRKLEGRGVKHIRHNISSRKKTLLIRFVILSVIAGALIYFLMLPMINKQKARNELIPAIQKLVNENLTPPTEAFDLALEAEKYISEDSVLIKLWPTLASTISMVTEPAGAEVFWKDYHTPEAEWRFAGMTSLHQVRLPRGYLRMEIRKEGYQTIEYAGPWAYGGLGPGIDTIKLDVSGNLPKNMIRIKSSEAKMLIVGLEQEGRKQVGEFLIDRYEVTNKQFKEFVDAGGYTNSSFWKYPFYSNGEQISSKDAFKMFVDRTGRPGPANWEAGTYPDGLENHPVTGVSWYEAAAYASFVNKQLPTVFHWSVVAETTRAEYIVNQSNFNMESTVPVGSTSGYSSYGVYDLAGNTREWCFNESTQNGQRYILGGGWNDPTYAFNDSYSQPALDRSSTNGFRCIQILQGDTAISNLTRVVPKLFRDYRKEKPVDNKTFAIFLNQFTYDESPLAAKVEEATENDLWKVEKVTFDVGYGNDRMQAWVYLPKNAKPPFQPILYFPGSYAIYRAKFDVDNWDIRRNNFILKSGRALIWPVYKGTYERFDELNSDLPNETVFYKDHVVMWGKELSRTIDYLESRTDIQVDKLGYLGFSWGGHLGGILPATEKRIKAVVLNVGGMMMNTTLPEADQLNYLPRVTQPTLMLNGYYDGVFPVETSQKPMFELLGTPAEHKKIIIYESGHLVPQIEYVKETLNWFDKYLGSVE